MATVPKSLKAVVKVALATVFTGPLAGAREAGVQALEILGSQDGGPAEERVLDQVAKELGAVAAGQNLAADDARHALETTEEIFRCHALTLAELTGLQMDPVRAAAELLRRGEPERRTLSEPADSLCRRAIASAYRGLLIDPAVLPGLERAFQQRALSHLDALADVPGDLRKILAVMAKFGVVDIEAAGPAVFFAGGWQRLEDAYLSPDEVFHRLGLGEDLRDFSPRPTLIAEIDTRLADPTVHSGWIVLEAEAGLGKTAVMAYLARTRQWAHHFAQRSNRDTTDRVLALRSLAAQLIPSCGLDELLHGGGLPDAAGRTDWFSRLLTAAARRRAAAGITEPLVVLVDGLDEAAAIDGDSQSIPLGLPEHLPDGVFIVAARRVGEETEILLPGQHRSIRIRATDEANVADLRRRVDTVAQEPTMSRILAEQGVDRDWFVRTLVDRCGGVWVYLQYVTVEIRTGMRAPNDLTGLGGSLWEYYRRNLTRPRDENHERWSGELPVLATLAAVGEPVTFELLCHLAGAVPSQMLRRSLDGPWFPFLQVQPPTGNAGGTRYAVYHASVGDFLAGRASTDVPTARQGIRAELEAAATIAHGRIADRYLKRWGGFDQGLLGLQEVGPHPTPDDLYGLRHLTGHLLAADREADLHRLLAAEYIVDSVPVNAWFDAHDRIGDLTGYVHDLSLARRRAELATDQDLSRLVPGSTIGLEVRYALIDGSLASLAANIPSQLLERLVSGQRWSAAHALAYAYRLHDPNQRHTALTALAQHLPDGGQRRAVLADALMAARGIANDGDRASALSHLAQHLPDDLLGAALTAARGITQQNFRAWSLANLAQHLPDGEERRGVLTDAVTAARSITNNHALAHALIDIAQHLPDDEERRAVLSDALSATRSITNEHVRTETLADLAEYLPDGQERWAVLSEALTATRSMTSDHDRARVLANLAQHLPDDEERRAVLTEALTATRSITDNLSRAWGLADLAQHLPDGKERRAVLTDAVSAACSITNYRGITKRDGIFKQFHVRTLADLAQHLPDGEERRAVLADALVAARGIANDDFRASMMADLAQRLPDGEERRAVLADALTAMRGITNDEARARVLAHLAEHLPDELLAGALTAARGITDDDVRTWARVNLAQHIPEGEERRAVLTEALAGTHRFTHDEARARTLAHLSEHLPDELLADALTAARGITDDKLRARTLAHLAQHIGDCEERQAVLTEALSITHSINDEYARTRLLADLAQQLSDDQLTDALLSGRNIADDHARAQVLADLAQHLSDGEQRHAVLIEALAATRCILNDHTRARRLADLAQHLPDGKECHAVLTEALIATRRITGEQARARTLVDMAQQLPDDLLAEALSASRCLADDHARTQALAALSQHLSDGEQRHAVLAEALNAARGTTDDLAGARTLADLAQHLPDDLLTEALTAVRSITVTEARARTLADLARHLPDGAQREAVVTDGLTAARGISNDHTRARTLADLGRQLPDGPQRHAVLTDALAAARSISSYYFRARALADLAQNQPDGPVVHATLESLGSGLGLSEDEVAPVFDRLLTLTPLAFKDFRLLLLAGSRPQQLARLARGVGVLSRVGGPEAVLDTAKAIRDVTRWWPSPSSA